MELREGDSRRCEAFELFRARVRDLFIYSSTWIHGSKVFEFFACILNLLCCLSHLSVDLEEAIGVDVRCIKGLCARVHDFYLDFFFSSMDLIYLSCTHTHTS